MGQTITAWLGAARAKAAGSGRAPWFLAGVLAGAVISGVLSNYPLTIDQCLRWAADRPTSMGVQVAKLRCYRTWGGL